jgi:hypothetical protein
MQNILPPVIGLLVAVGALIVFLWPLRTIVQSAKVRGLTKIGWIALWLGGFFVGGIADNLIFRYARSHQLAPIFATLLPVALIVVGLLPVWLVYFLFKRRTRDLPDLQSRAESLGFKLGKRFRALRVGSK